MGEIASAAAAPVKSKVCLGKPATYSADAYIPAPLREGALEALSRKLYSYPYFLHLKKLGVQVPLQSHAAGRCVSDEAFSRTGGGAAAAGPNIQSISWFPGKDDVLRPSMPKRGVGPPAPEDGCASLMIRVISKCVRRRCPRTTQIRIHWMRGN